DEAPLDLVGARRDVAAQALARLVEPAAQLSRRRIVGGLHALTAPPPARRFRDVLGGALKQRQVWACHRLRRRRSRARASARRPWCAPRACPCRAPSARSPVPVPPVAAGAAPAGRGRAPRPGPRQAAAGRGSGGTAGTE